jgi:hypothetical protein
MHDSDPLIIVLLGDDPQSIVNTLLEELRHGTTEVELASIVCYAAALRIAQFHTRNEFSDWDAALHTFTFSNAVHQGLRSKITNIPASLLVYCFLFLSNLTIALIFVVFLSQIHLSGIQRSDPYILLSI